MDLGYPAPEFLHILDFIGAKNDGRWWVVTIGAIRCAKLQSNRQHQQTNTQSFYRLDALPVTQPTVSKQWREKYHILWTCLTQAHWGLFQLCLWPLIAPGHLGGGLPCLSSTQYPRLNIMSIHNKEKKYFYLLLWASHFCGNISRLLNLISRTFPRLSIFQDIPGLEFVCLFAWGLTELSAQLGYIMP